MRTVLILAAMVLPFVASAEVFDLGGSFVAFAEATMPGCTDSDGGGSVSEAVAACAAGGYSAAARAEAAASATTAEGSVFAFAEGAATSIGNPGTQSASGNASGTAVNSWTMDADTYYVLSIEASGGATAEFTDDVSGPFPPSGILVADTYTLRATALANAIAEDSGGAQTVTAGPRAASGQVMFADVGSPDLIRGTITAGGTAMPGVRVEARDAGGVVKIAFTGDDGAYLLPDLPGTVTLEISHPLGGFVPLQSPLLTPPTTFDADLVPHAVPMLSLGARSFLVVVLLGAAGRRAWRLHRAR